MAAFAGLYDPAAHGIESQNYLGNRAYASGWAAPTAGDSVYAEEVLHDGEYLEALLATIAMGTLVPGTPTPETPTNYDGILAPMPQDDFFEKVFLLPHTVEVGLVLSPKSYSLHLYNSFKHEVRYLIEYLNTAGAGIVIPDLPAIPAAIPPQSGINLTLQILTSGPPNIDGFLHFVFDTGDPVLWLSGQRTILIPYEPEVPIEERLEFLTDVRMRKNGTEQRASLRAAPRQIFDVTYLLTDRERQEFQVILEDSQSRALGLPIWFEGTTLSAPTTIGSPTVSVAATAYSDLRADGLAVIYQDSTNFETLEVESFNAGSVTFKSNVTKDFPVGTRIMPVRVTYAGEVVRGFRHAVGVQNFRVQLRARDNTIDLSDTAAFSSYNGKVLLDDPNMIEDTLPEAFERKMVILDGDAGVFDAVSPWGLSRRTHSKRFVTRTRQRLWEVRRLLHALRGRAISFYIPTFYPDLTPTQPITLDGLILTFRNIGYSRFIDDRAPYDVIRLRFTDGTSVIRHVESSNEVDPTEEQITVDAPWGKNATVGEIVSVEFVEKVRMDDDAVTISHRDGNGSAVIEMPVKAVLE